MKKTIAIAAVAAMIPFAAHAKTAITDAEMGSVTGQAGVSINLDLAMDIHMDAMAWGDADGIKDATTGGWIGMKNFDITKLKLQMRDDYVYGGPGSTLNGKGWGDLQAFSIDVATADGTVAGANASNRAYAAGTAFVRMGLGTLQVKMEQMAFDVALGSNYAAADLSTPGAVTAKLTQEMGSVQLDGFNMRLGRGGYVDIMARAGQGVNFGLNVKIDTMSMSSLSWGNAYGVSGINGAEQAGFVGLKNFNALGIGIQGTVGIQVATATGTATGFTEYLPGTIAFVNQGGAANAPSFVHISFGDGSLPNGADSTDYTDTTSNGVTFSMAKMTTDIAVGQNANLQTGSKSYGTVAIEGLNFSIKGFVDIGAHNSADPNAY